MMVLPRHFAGVSLDLRRHIDGARDLVHGVKAEAAFEGGRRVPDGGASQRRRRGGPCGRSLGLVPLGQLGRQAAGQGRGLAPQGGRGWARRRRGTQGRGWGSTAHLVCLMQVAGHADVAGWRGWAQRLGRCPGQWRSSPPLGQSGVGGSEALPAGHRGPGKCQTPPRVGSHRAKLGGRATRHRIHRGALGGRRGLHLGCAQGCGPPLGPEARLRGGPCHSRGLARERRARPAAGRRAIGTASIGVVAQAGLVARRRRQGRGASGGQVRGERGTPDGGRVTARLHARPGR